MQALVWSLSRNQQLKTLAQLQQQATTSTLTERHLME